MLDATKILYRKRANPVRNVEYTNVVRMRFIFLKGDNGLIIPSIWNNVSVIFEIDVYGLFNLLYKTFLIRLYNIMFVFRYYSIICATSIIYIYIK